jgi:very-short-patch-repair endonuclease
MTDVEVVLWTKVRRKQLFGIPFYRQKPIGNYIVDFYCPKAQLVIEVDGGQHYKPEGALRDSVRDSFLKDLGFSVLRFSNRDVLYNIDGVFATIVRHVEAKLYEGRTKSP